MKNWKDVRKEFNFTPKEEKQIQKRTQKMISKIDKRNEKLLRKKEKIENSAIVKV